MKKIQTYLPVFSGFYGTFWECDNEDYEIESINNIRREKGFKEIKFEDCQFDYNDYENSVGQKVTVEIERYFQELGMLKSISFEEIISPREYNFRNDSINVTIELTEENENKILSYLKEHEENFKKYLKEKYTSRSGFISFVTNDLTEFMEDSPLEDNHKLGSILDFIFMNEGQEEINIYYNVEMPIVYATNYEELTNPTIEEITEENRIIEFVIPNWALSYLINGDYSGITQEDKVKIDKFINDCFVHYSNTSFNVGESEGFTWRNDIDNLGSDCHKVTLLDMENVYKINL